MNERQLLENYIYGDVEDDDEDDSNSSIVSETPNRHYHAFHEDKKWTLEYATFLVIGLSYLWPWNSFLAATAYFSTRLSHNEYLQANLSSFIMAMSTITGTTASLILAERQRGAKYTGRVFLGEVIIFGVFIVMALSCILKSVGTISYFLFIMVCVWGASLGTAFAQNGSFAVVNTIDSVYTQAVMVGQAISGVLPPIISLISASIGGGGEKKHDENDTGDTSGGTSSAMYFLVASLVAGVAFVMFHKVQTRHRHLLDRNEIDEYQGVNIQEQDGETEGVEAADEGEGPFNQTKPNHIHVPLRVLLQKLKSPAFGVFFTFTVTLVYPVFSNSINSVNGIRYEIFVPLAILIWNLGDLAGRVICGYDKYVVKTRKTFVIYALLRLLFIPAYLLCNINGREGIIRSDIFYMLIHLLFGLTNGHLGSSGMMTAPDYVQDHEKAATGGFMTLVLSLGLTCGSLLSFILVSAIF